ncbi:MAG TPA: hypothetical protein VKQ72_04080, partial [Aggregatilineales bacterium]|nr:hypothetical protein [Aggregatilineales bacterium]
TPAIQELIGSGGNVTALKADWQLHLGREIDLLKINKHFLGQDRDTHILSEIPASVRVMAPVRIDPQVSIGPNARIGPNVYVESGAHVGQDAVISNALILANADIPNGDDVHNQIVGRRMRIADDMPDANKTRPSRPQDWDARLQKGQKG